MSGRGFSCYALCFDLRHFQSIVGRERKKPGKRKDGKIVRFLVDRERDYLEEGRDAVSRWR